MARLLALDRSPLAGPKISGELSSSMLPFGKEMILRGFSATFWIKESKVTIGAGGKSSGSNPPCVFTAWRRLQGTAWIVRPATAHVILTMRRAGMLVY
jgi:hypothetical protein